MVSEFLYNSNFALKIDFMQELGVIVLAAGQGTRMKSDLPKVLHPVGGKPLLLHALETARDLKPNRIAVVIGHGAERVRQADLANDLRLVLQEQQLGTGHAVLCARHVFEAFTGDIVILSGDVPLIRESTLQAMVEHHRRRQAVVTLLTACLTAPMGYGRILRDSLSALAGIFE